MFGILKGYPLAKSDRGYWKGNQRVYCVWERKDMESGKMGEAQRKPQSHMLNGLFESMHDMNDLVCTVRDEMNWMKIK